tara:strand:- start:1732 stop:2238 length:507 start_codon:yes stop_codon:yes gene_type:complete
MSVFPTIAPNSVDYDFGVAQVSEYEAFGLGPIIFRHTNSINNQKFSLKYQGLNQASIILLRNHYVNNSGTAGQFTVPAEAFGDIDLIDATAIYRYEQTPTEEHAGAGLYNITISLRALTGVILEFVLNGGNATLPSEESVDKYVFVGTSPLILDGSDAATATLILDGN